MKATSPAAAGSWAGPFELEGEVVYGDQRGGTLGFPTANLSPDPHMLVPAYGIYAGEALGHRVAASIGVNPHYGGSERRIEAFLLDFEGDLYGSRLRLELWERLREERAFASEEDLVAQIAADVEAARAAATRLKRLRKVFPLGRLCLAYGHGRRPLGPLPRLRSGLREADQARPRRRSCVPGCGYVGWIPAAQTLKKSQSRPASPRIRCPTRPGDHADAAEVVVERAPEAHVVAVLESASMPGSSNPGSTWTIVPGRVEARPVDGLLGREPLVEDPREHLHERGPEARAAGGAGARTSPSASRAAVGDIMLSIRSPASSGPMSRSDSPSMLFRWTS